MVPIRVFIRMAQTDALHPRRCQPLHRRRAGPFSTRWRSTQRRRCRPTRHDARPHRRQAIGSARHLPTRRTPATSTLSVPLSRNAASRYSSPRIPLEIANPISIGPCSPETRSRPAPPVTGLNESPAELASRRLSCRCRCPPRHIELREGCRQTHVAVSSGSHRRGRCRRCHLLRMCCYAAGRIEPSGRRWCET